jgi:hypothetical protein
MSVLDIEDVSGSFARRHGGSAGGAPECRLILCRIYPGTSTSGRYSPLVLEVIFTR